MGRAKALLWLEGAEKQDAIDFSTLKKISSLQNKTVWGNTSCTFNFTTWICAFLQVGQTCLASTLHSNVSFFVWSAHTLTIQTTFKTNPFYISQHLFGQTLS